MFLALTGFEVHGTFKIFGFEKAAEFHRTASWMLIGLIIFAIFWHLTTGEWRHYIPTTKQLKEQVIEEVLAGKFDVRKAAADYKPEE